MEIIAWIGAVAFALTGIPQAWKCYKQGHAHGISYMFLLLWMVGEICMMVAYYQELPLLVNYVFNLLCIFIIWFYRLFPRK